MMTEKATPLSEVLYAFAVAGPVVDPETLDAFTRRYPQYAGQLTAFAIDLLLEAALPEDEEAADLEEEAVSPAVARAISHFHNVSYELEKAGQAHTAAAEDLFAGMDKDHFRAFAKDINATTLFAIKLRDRLIEPETIITRTGFCQKVATALGVSLAAVVAYLKRAPAVSQSAAYKAEKKPTAATRESFEEAVRRSGLTGEQQRYLLDL